MKQIFAAVLLATVYAAEAEAETATPLPVGPYKTAFSTTASDKNLAVVKG